MDYDPVKNRLGHLFSGRPLLQRLFYALLDLFFLRAWYVQREIRGLFSSRAGDVPIRVLDAGTGFGQYAHFLVRTFPNAHVTAVDVKQDYLDNALRFFEGTRYASRVQFAIDDLTRLRTEGPFDFILSVDVMEHIEDDVGVFRHFARVLAPGGFVMINTPSNLGGSDVRGDEGGFIGEHVRDGYSIEEIESKLRDAGLEPVRSIYTYGPFGSLAWRLLIKVPMQLLGRTRLALVLLPIYYLPVLPLGLLLNALDLWRRHEAGTGLLVTARKNDIRHATSALPAR
jgi:SAM-dependent methyltransferase